MSDPRLVSAARVDDDVQYEAGLRPRTLNDYIGQDKVRENLQVSIAAARGRGEALDHVLLYGPPGLGKTTLATVIANEMGVPVRVDGRPGDRAGRRSGGDAHQPRGTRGAVHRRDPPHGAGHRGDPLSGDGGLRARHHDRPGPERAVGEGAGKPFTLIGATTRAGMLTSPLRARFGIVQRLDFYTAADLEEIVRRSARILGVTLELDAARELAGRSRGTPRVANRLLRRVRDFAEVRADGVITLDVAHAALRLLEVDERGFDDLDCRLLRTIIDKYGGGPGRAQQPGGVDWRRRRGPRGHLRAVSDADWLSRSHAPRPGGHGARVPVLWPGSTGQRRQVVVMGGSDVSPSESTRGGCPGRDCGG